jgi:hypothetical protein
MNFIVFENNKNDEIPKETIIITSGIFNEEIKDKYIENVGNTFCDIISLDTNKINQLLKKYTPSGYDFNIFNLELISRTIADATSNSKNCKKDTHKNEKLFLKELTDISPLFLLYEPSSMLYRSIYEDIKTIEKFKKYIGLCFKDSFYMNPDFIRFLCDAEEILYIERPPKIGEIGIGAKKIESCDFEGYRAFYENIKGHMETKYNAGSFEDICAASLLELAKNNFIIKICKNCGKYFIPFFRSDTIYCDRKSPQDRSKTCKEYGAQKAYSEHLKESKAARLYRNIYMSKQMLVKRNPDILEYKDAFEGFKKRSKEWKSLVKSGEKTEQDFIIWLKDVKSNKNRLIL